MAGIEQGGPGREEKAAHVTSRPAPGPGPLSPVPDPVEGPLPDGRLVMDGFARWVLPSLEPRPERVPYLRRQVGRVLHMWRLESLAWQVELVVTELATNAVRHARTLFTVSMTWDGRRLRIEVSDAHPVPPRPQGSPPPEAVGGRGLLLVEQIADRWGYDPHAHGKTIWCDLKP